MPSSTRGRVNGETQRDGEKWTFFVPGPLPGMNEIIAAAKVAWTRGRRLVAGGGYAEMKRTWTQAAAAAARSAGIPRLGPVAVSFEWIEPTRRRDPDNISAGKKFVLDGLVAADVIGGDGWRWIRSITETFSVDKVRHGVRVTLEEVSDDEDR